MSGKGGRESEERRMQMEAHINLSFGLIEGMGIHTSSPSSSPASPYDSLSHFFK